MAPTTKTSEKTEITPNPHYGSTQPKDKIGKIAQIGSKHLHLPLRPTGRISTIAVPTVFEVFMIQVMIANLSCGSDIHICEENEPMIQTALNFVYEPC